MIKERVQDFTVNLSPMVSCWIPGSSGREAEKLRWHLGGEATPCCFLSEIRWLPWQKLYICRNLSVTTSQNGILSNPHVFSLFLLHKLLSFSSWCTQADKTSYPCFCNGLCKCRNGIFDLLYIKQFCSAYFQLFSWSWGTLSLVRKITHYYLGVWRWENSFQNITTLTCKDLQSACSGGRGALTCDCSAGNVPWRTPGLFQVLLPCVETLIVTIKWPFFFCSFSTVQECIFGFDSLTSEGNPSKCTWLTRI